MSRDIYGGSTEGAEMANVESAATSTLIFAANLKAVNRMVHNDSSAILYLKYGSAASDTSYTVEMGPGDYFEFPTPCYRGVVYGIWASANGYARTTEVAV